MRSRLRSWLNKSRWSCTVLRGGRSFGIARHWHPVLKIYIIPFITSRSSTWRLLPPRLAGGINGSTSAHSSSVRSLGYRNERRPDSPRFFAVHIGDPPRIRLPLLNHKRFRRFNMFSDRHIDILLVQVRDGNAAGRNARHDAGSRPGALTLWRLRLHACRARQKREQDGGVGEPSHGSLLY